MRPESETAPPGDKAAAEEASRRAWAPPKMRRLVTSAAEVAGSIHFDGVEQLS
jgi:hypothetical protein